MATVDTKTKHRRLRERAEHLPGGHRPQSKPTQLPLHERLDEAELRRRFWHISPGFLPLVLWGINHGDPMSTLMKTIVIAIMVLLGGSIFTFFHMVERRGEQTDRAGAVFGYAGSVLATLFFFPAQAELGLTVLVVLAFGDGSATLGGKLFGGRKLPWNPSKTWSGFLSFLVVGVPVASVIYWGETNLNAFTQDPPPGFSTALICGGTAVVLAAFAESIQSRINDNIRVGIVAAIGVVTAHSLTVGF